MKRCPECRRDYTDETLNFCLDDGSALLEGPASGSEPATAVIHTTDAVGDAPTRAHINTTGQTAVLPSESIAMPKRGFDKRLIAVPLVFAIIIAAGFFGYRYLGSSEAGQINSIAVLPFTNSSGDKETDFLSDGIAETLINNFTKIPELKVTARSTAFRFRGREDFPKEIGRELNVGSILTGKVLQRGDSVSIQVDLVNTTDGLQIWGDRYDGPVADIIRIQQKIATDVSSHLKLKLTGAQASQFSKPYTQNADAYQHYLRGRYYWNRRTPENISLAITEFQLAADKDPNYALAYVGLADSYILLDEHAGVPSTETVPKAKANAEKALALDNELAEVYTTLGSIYHNLWQWKEADAAFKRSIELNPNYPTAYHWYSLMLGNEGRADEAHEMIKKGAELDPLSLVIKYNLADSYRARGAYDAALAECHNIQALDPNFTFVPACFGAVYVDLGRLDEALAEYQKYAAAGGERSRVIVFVACGFARTGRAVDAKEQLKKLNELYTLRRASAINVAEVYDCLEDADKAFEWIEKAFASRDSQLGEIGDRDSYKFIKKDPRYEPALKRLGLR
jgi:TolB-like protein/Flp pilus assembly protein TadD